ncbi:hypothetical protein CJF31_00010764 [Rutstroemia sp. NJR-2017a BVV2]|nr:hypothetical protein CJF31_00010764 [Rutstroemia sp. NJR-2017a BVV2]
MPISKHSISAPLEAGSSIFQPTQLPAELHEALDYVSARLVRKRLHLSLIVAKKDIQIQSAGVSQSAPGFSSPTTGFFNNTPFARLTRDNVLDRSRNASPPTSPRFGSPASNASSATNFSTSSSDLSLRSTSSAATSISNSTIYLSRTKWSGLPSSPKDSPTHHRQESQPQSPTSSTCSTPALPSPSTPTPNPYGITLIHSTALTPRADRILRRTIALAEHKFPHIGSAWLSISDPSEDLIRRSLAQRSLVYASQGLDLYSLDFVYTFKQALHTYSRTLSAVDLSAAVDELRRLVLVQNGRRVAKGYLLRCYAGMGFSLSALVDVDEAYKNIYGGSTRQGGIEVAVEDPRSPPALKTVFGKEEDELVEVGESAKGRDGESPVWEARREELVEGKMEMVEINKGGMGFGVRMSILGMGTMREDRGPFMRGNRTPNRGTDCSPATKDEWRNLMMGEQRWSLEVVEGW